jgi:hypothetical protein
MILASLDDISAETLENLVANPVREKLTIDYKSSIYGTKYAERREFLADVSSFANSAGGDLVIGIEEKAGLPVTVPGFNIGDIDQEVQRLQQMVLQALEPRLTGVEMHPVPLSNGNHVLVIRIPHSWNAPHRVVLEGHDKFYARDTNGKHPMNVDELRQAFTLSDRVEQRIRGFRRERFQAIKTNQTFELLPDGAALILHLIPLSAATTRNFLSVEALQAKQQLLRSIGSGGSVRINLDGIIFYSGTGFVDGRKQRSTAYTQLYRNGTIEAVTAFASPQTENIIPSEAYERWLIEALGPYLRAQRELGIAPPVYLFLGFAKAGQYRFAVNPSSFFPASTLSSGYLDREDIELVEAVIEDLTEEPARVLLPLFDQVWQAFGFDRSLNFDEKGNWTGQH